MCPIFVKTTSSALAVNFNLTAVLRPNGDRSIEYFRPLLVEDDHIRCRTTGGPLGSEQHRLVTLERCIDDVGASDYNGTDHLIQLYAPRESGAQLYRFGFGSLRRRSEQAQPKQR